MKREELALALAARHHITKAAARDELDEVVHKILTALREGRSADLPGVGRLTSSKTASMEPAGEPGSPKSSGKS